MLKKIQGLCSRRCLLYSLVPGSLAGLSLTFGRIWEQGGSLSLLGWGSVLQILIYSLLFTALNLALLSRIQFRENTAPVPGKGADSFSRRRFLALWIGMFLCWIPVFLAYYPTIWAYDVGKQLPHIRGRAVTTYQPLLHTLYLETVVRIGSRPGNYELGMVLLSLTQMLGMAGMFSYGIETTRRWGSSKCCRILLFCFFALFPVNSILSVSMTKDVLFSGCWLVCSLKLYEIVDHPDLFFRSQKKQLSFIVFLCLTLSLRANAVYAFGPAMIFGILIFSGIWRKRLAVLCLVGFCIYGVFQGSLFQAMNAKRGYAQEAFCIPMQCLVGTAIRHPELIPEYGSGQLLLDVIPRDWFTERLEDSYDPHLADPVKERWWMLEEDFDSAHLVKVWISYGMRYPADYLDIWGTLTLGAWYPLDKTHASIYDGDGEERQGYLLTDYKNIPEIGMERPPSKWPWLEGLYEKIATENLHQKIPVVSLLFVPAFYCWLMLFCIFLALYQRKYQELLPMAMLFFYWGTVLLGPTIVVRYLYPVIVTVPIVFSRLRVRFRRTIE